MCKNNSQLLLLGLQQLDNIEYHTHTLSYVKMDGHVCYCITTILYILMSLLLLCSAKGTEGSVPVRHPSASGAADTHGNSVCSHGLCGVLSRR